MGIFSRIFKFAESAIQPEIQFGRMTTTVKSPTQYESWNTAITLFEQERYLKAYTHLLDYLSDSDEGNVEYTNNVGKLSFRLYQGSRLIEGFANAHVFKVRVKIARFLKPNPILMQWLLEENYFLKYTRFSIDEDHCICLVFDTYVEDGTPYKIYEALRELAIKADTKDDVLLIQFPELTPVEPIRVRIPTQEEMDVRYRFMLAKIEDTIREVATGSLNINNYLGGVSFLLLDTLFRIDFLVKPEGTIMEDIQKVHDMFFNNSVLDVAYKNQYILQTLKNIATTDYNDFERQIYDVKRTFGQSYFEGQISFRELVRVQMSDFDWYYNQGYPKYAQAICGYIVGYALYAISLPVLTRTLLMFYYRITEADFFRDMGYVQEVYIESSRLNKSKIIDELKRIYKLNIPQKHPTRREFDRLQFDDIAIFGRTLLEMIADLEYEV